MAYVWYGIAALAEIGGCFCLWLVLRADKPIWLLVPGVASLLLFAAVLTRVDAASAGRAYAAYGGVYILSAIAWQWVVEKQLPDRWDLAGGAICLLGSLVILWGPRTG